MTSEVAIYDPGQQTPARIEFNEQQIALMKDQFGRDLSDSQFAFCLEICRRTGLNPMANQIHFVPRKSRGKDENGRWVEKVTLTVQTGIDGYRLIGHRTDQVAGTDGPYWCGPDGEWRDVWLLEEPPAAAKYGIRRTGQVDYTYNVATYREFVQLVPEYEGSGETRRKVGNRPNEMWQRMPANQLAKCAEAGAWRKAFPQELSGIFTDAEGGASEIVARVESERDEPERPRIQQPQPKRAEPASDGPKPARKPRQQPRRSSAADWGGAGNADGEAVSTMGDEVVDTTAREIAEEEKPVSAQEPQADRFGEFWNALQEELDGRPQDIRDVAMVLNTSPNPVGLRAWWKANSLPGQPEPIDVVRRKLDSLAR